MDYKEWIMERAYDLAQERYGKPYFDLTDSQQAELFGIAEEAYTNYHAALIDAAYEAELDRRMFGKGVNTNEED